MTPATPCARTDVVLGIVERDGRVLICRRPAHTTFPGYWEFPGGKREAGETAEQCLTRELREELEIDVAPAAAFEPLDHDYPNARIRLLPFLCTLTSGEPRPVACEEICWVDPRDLYDFQFPPANEPLLDQVIRRLTHDG